MSGEAVDYDVSWLNERDEYLEGVYQDLKRLRDSGVLEGKRIATVGCWSNAGEVNQILSDLGLSISIIADNNPNKQGVSRLGIIAQSVQSLADEDNIVILVLNNYMTNFWRSFLPQLNGLGFVRDVDYFVVFGGERYRQEVECPDDSSLPTHAWWQKICGYAEKGHAGYMEVARQYPGLPIWLMHQPSLGDLYMFSLFLPAAMGARSIAECDCVLIVTKNSVKKLAEAIGFKHVVLIPLEEAYCNWLSTMRLMGDKLKNLHNAVFHGQNMIGTTTLLWNTSINFRDTFTKYVFRFQEEVTPIYPQFPRRREVVRAIFEELHLKPGKTVLISPYAGHFEAAITPGQWNRLVGGLLEQGYSVCTNCGGPKEPPLPGTVPVFIELRDCVEFAETAGYFIGVRSGLCDVVCMADCRKVVLYDAGAPASSIKFFGFASMGLGDGNILELVNDCVHTDEMLDSIVASFG